MTGIRLNAVKNSSMASWYFRLAKRMMPHVTGSDFREAMLDLLIYQD
ncbi:MAG: hypothetical protein OXE78_01235 [Gammaproteobacteria bacterium]|nr:hypothetical protein [Gammaproteobacteria bacterium]